MSLEELFQGPRALSHVPASYIQHRVVKTIPAERYTKPKSKHILQQDPDSRFRGRLYRTALGARRRRVKINEARHQETPSSPWRDASQYPSSHGSKPRKSETLARISCCFFFTLLPSISNRSAEAWIGRSRTSSQDHTHGAEARCARAVDEVCNASGRLEALAFWFWLRG
jgi:hypothetical protein